ncbi:histidine phosphatase family protein [Gordonia zhaorongruii]|uniref:histidine phosphatase family protein n=1 Tax=Gordonia zhaorongruii TaxID=2597659 RepID=UPI00104F73CC|nr:histidine phosphatase family protein [Gordonia zhaorongruii]
MHTIVVAGRTAPNRAVRFGGENDDLDARGRRDAGALRSGLPAEACVVAGPEASVRQTAGLLGRPFDVDPALLSLDVGRWFGRGPESVDQDELAAWFGHPEGAPHGGEAVADFVARVRAALAAHDDGCILVVASPVAQAMLCASAEEFFGVRVHPGSMVRVPEPS